MYTMSKREHLITAAKQLLWEKGYEATSPRDIQLLSSAGQGSFYHHFKSKHELGVEVLAQVADERIASFEAAFGAEGPVKERIVRFLDRPVEPLKGCRIGRMVWDAAVHDPALRQPLARYFDHLMTRIEQALTVAEREGQVTLRLPARQIAVAVVAALQGGFTLSRAQQESAYLGETVAAVRALLDLAISDQ
jgi:TetR/AcrR family transcriptional regulator, transcriptional repressor for nem operon